MYFLLLLVELAVCVAVDAATPPASCIASITPGRLSIEFGGTITLTRLVNVHR